MAPAALSTSAASWCFPRTAAHSADVRDVACGTEDTASASTSAPHETSSRSTPAWPCARTPRRIMAAARPSSGACPGECLSANISAHSDLLRGEVDGGLGRRLLTNAQLGAADKVEARVNLRTRIEEQRHSSRAPGGARGVQRRDAILIGGVRARASLEEQLDAPGRRRLAREMERRAPVTTPRGGLNT